MIAALSGVTQEGVRELGIAVHASLAIFDSVVTKNLTADTVTTKKLCIDDVCVTKAQLQQMLDAQAASATSAGGAGGTSTSTLPSGSTTPDTTPPVIRIIGANPTTVPIGSAYSAIWAQP
jgi:hypothetical protein